MCGIAGFRSSGAQLAPDSLRRITEAMTATLAHRGPDDADLWIDPAAGVALGHRRLSIIDLSAAGRQPMTSACGRYVITYNGEIYNFRELRAQLEQHGHAFRGHSDTEVLLAALAEWGVAAALGRVRRGDVAPFEGDLAAGRLRESQDRIAGGRLAAAAFAHQRHRLATLDVERDAVDGLHRAACAAEPRMDREMHLQPPHGDKRAHATPATRAACQQALR